MRRRSLVLGLPALAGACAAREVPPSLQALQDGRLLVLGPSAEFDPGRPPPGWSQLNAERGAVIAVTQEAGRPVLTFDAPGGRMLVRMLDLPLIAAPGLSWAWKLETEAFGGGAGDGLSRGLQLTIGFKGGGPTDLIRPRQWMRDGGGFPAHDRRIDIALRGPGATRTELASIELEAVADGGPKRTLRPASRGLTGGWISEFIDLLALFRGFFPQDRFGEVTFAFVAVGALPARLPDGIPAPVGHIVEVQVFR